MTDFVIRNQTPQHVELRGPEDVLVLAPLQHRRLGDDPWTLYGAAAAQARSEQVVDWEPEPTRSTVLQMASVSAVLGLVTVGGAVSALVRDHRLWGSVGLAVALACFGGSAMALHLGHRSLFAPAEAPARQLHAAPRRPRFTELLRDLLVGCLQYSAFLCLVVVGTAAPAAALYLGTDLSRAVTFDGLHVDLAEGDALRHVVVVRSMQLVLVILVSLVPALMYFQFDREKMTTLVDRWLHVIFRLDPTLRTVADVDAKYGRRVEEYLGAPLLLGSDLRSKRLRDRSSVVLTTLLLALGWIVVVLSVPTQDATGQVVSVPEMFHPLLTPVTMAFLGAYFLSIQVALRGFVRGDLKPKTYNVITVRILMAVVLAWALQAVLGDSPPVLAACFLSGLVPNTVLLQLRSAARGKPSVDSELTQRYPLTQIDEIDVYERTRLEEEGITSVQALARHDLVDLMLSSRIPASRLIDWVDQAILQQHGTEEVVLRLRQKGVRCATDLVRVCDDPVLLAELTKDLEGICSPTLLRGVLERRRVARQPGQLARQPARHAPPGPRLPAGRRRRGTGTGGCRCPRRARAPGARPGAVHGRRSQPSAGPAAGGADAGGANRSYRRAPGDLTRAEATPDRGPGWRRVTRRPGSGRLLEDVHAAGGAEPDDVGEADLRPLDLTRARLPPQVVRDLPDVRDAGRGDRVALGLQAARHVDRRAAVAERRTGLEEVDRTALGAEHQVVVVHELGRREAVVQLDQVEVGRRDAGDVVRLLRRPPGQRVDVGQHLAALLVRVARQDRGGDLDGPATLVGVERLELGVADEHCRRGAVAVRRAHGPGVRVGDHDVVHDHLERHRLAVGRERVERRVRVVLLGDAGEQLERDAAVLVAVLHADLREGARHAGGAEPAVEVHHGAVRAARGPRLRVVLAAGRRRAGLRR